MRKKVKVCGDFSPEFFVNHIFCARSLWGEERFVHGTGGLRRRVGSISKVQETWKFPLPEPAVSRTPVAASSGEREMECTVGSASRQVRLYS